MKSPAPRTVLLVAFHYPPCGVSSGLQRALAFSIHLRSFGWRPVVLTVRPGAYDAKNRSQLADIPEDVPVIRAPALDAARHLALGGRYWSRLAIPDRWRSWWIAAVPLGLAAIRRERVAAIWSTYPVSTAHSIGATLSRLTGLPWVADFRDPMVEYFPERNEVFPDDARLRKARLSIERKAATHASRLVFCTESARAIVAARYTGVKPYRLRVIPNGYDEEAFNDAVALSAHKTSDRHVLLHSGTIYAGTDRDPTMLFRAIKALQRKGIVDAQNFELRLRNPANEAYFRALAGTEGVQDLVTVAPPLSYREALAEMLVADGLVLLQGVTSNPAIPAKLYEYLRAGRPILGLVHPEGESAKLLTSLGIKTAPLDDQKSIEALLTRWIDAKYEGGVPARDVVSYSRSVLTGKLAELLNEVTDGETTR